MLSLEHPHLKGVDEPVAAKHRRLWRGGDHLEEIPQATRRVVLVCAHAQRMDACLVQNARALGEGGRLLRGAHARYLCNEHHLPLHAPCCKRLPARAPNRDTEEAGGGEERTQGMQRENIEPSL